MLKFAKNLEPRKAWSAMFFSIFYHHGIQQNQQQHCRSVFWKEFIFFCGYIITGVPWWLGGYSTGFWIRGWGFDSSSLSSPYGLYLILIEIHEKNCHQFTHFWKAFGNKSSNQKLPFWQVKMKKMWVLQYANNIDKIVGYTAILTTKSGWTSLLSLLSIVFSCCGLKVCINWSQWRLQLDHTWIKKRKKNLQRINFSKQNLKVWAEGFLFSITFLKICLAEFFLFGLFFHCFACY